MHGEFDEEDREPAGRHRDREIALGPNMLLILFFCLALVCGLCFGWGYSMGSRSAQEAAAANQPPSSMLSSLAGLRPKPSATAQNTPQEAPQQRTVVALPAPNASSAHPAPAAPVVVAAPAAPTYPAQATVQPALPPQQIQPQPVQARPAPALPAPAAPVKLQPAPPLALMVQIAAVSHQEDAEVLVSALRKRGYAVTVRRELADSLIHVRIGPFTSHEEANNWRQKLLNDGYNAIVQQ